VAQKSKLLTQYNSLLFLSHPVYIICTTAYHCSLFSIFHFIELFLWWITLNNTPNDCRLFIEDDD